MRVCVVINVICNNRQRRNAGWQDGVTIVCGPVVVASIFTVFDLFHVGHRDDPLRLFALNVLQRMIDARAASLSNTCARFHNSGIVHRQLWFHCDAILHQS